MKSLYHYPLEDGEDRMHSPDGVRNIVERSSLMSLLRELERDGFDVSGAAAELTALINYANSTMVSGTDLLTHLEYCAQKVRENLPEKIPQ